MDEKRQYFPEIMPRKGEVTAWVLTIVALVGVFFLSQRQEIPFWAWFFVSFLTFSAASISLGNWMDRRTFIQVHEEGVIFENGLRKTRLTWQEISEVRTSPARWGTAVQVVGLNGHFSFTTFGEMQFQGQVRARTGFKDGTAILNEIITACGMKKKSASGSLSIYSRE